MSCGISEAGLAVILSSIFIGTGSIIGITKKDVISCKCCCLSCNQNVSRQIQSPRVDQPNEAGLQTLRIRDMSSEVNRTVNVFDRTKSAIRKLSSSDDSANKKKTGDLNRLKNKSFP